MDTDVLVVGAGPTGLMMASQLARRGVRCMIVDRHEGPVKETRALGVQARTLEVYARLGVVERALELGRRGAGANLWADGRRMARVPLGDAGLDVTPYPYILILGQDDNERILGDKLTDVGAAVRWNTELVALEQNAARVAATLRLPDGATRVVEAAWVAGCDGARSAVRQFSGIEFLGAPYEHVFFVADVQASGNMVPDEVNVYLWRTGFHLFFPMRGDGHWRLVGILPEGLRQRDGIGFDDVVPSLLAEAGVELSIRSCAWFSTYRIHHRRAEWFRDRRCFLLGDAAHVHSPVGAQGMNTGLQDAYNLGWKMALVATGRADARLLDSYEAERLPVARRLLSTTDRAFRLIVSGNPLAQLLRTRVLARIVARAMREPRIQRWVFRIVSQIGIHYGHSPLGRTAAALPDGAVRAGDRFPWLKLSLEEGGPVVDLFDLIDDMRFMLFVFGQPVPHGLAERFGDLLRVQAVPALPANAMGLERARIAARSFHLLRPDGYVGYCGETLEVEGVATYFRECIALAV